MKPENKSLLQQLSFAAGIATVFFSVGRHTGITKFDQKKLEYYQEGIDLKSEKKNLETKLLAKDKVIDSLQSLLDEWRSWKSMDLDFINEEAQVEAYIRRMSKVAVSEMEKFGIPASVKMAQGIVESQAGNHPLAVNYNNHFGPPLTGHYDSVWENWRMHSLVIKNEFPTLLDFDRSYKEWAKGLGNLGYSRDPYYSEKLIKVIEKYQLYLLDEGD